MPSSQLTIPLYTFTHVSLYTSGQEYMWTCLQIHNNKFSMLQKVITLANFKGGYLNLFFIPTFIPIY